MLPLVKIEFIWMDCCSKCWQAKPLLEEIGRHPRILVIPLPAKYIPKSIVEKYELKHVPVLLVHSDGRYVGKIEKGFTKEGLRKQIKELTSIDIEKFLKEEGFNDRSPDRRSAIESE